MLEIVSSYKLGIAKIDQVGFDVLWRSGFDRRGLCYDGVLFEWVLWRSDFDHVVAEIMGLLVF